jgi:hypothetical protein
VSLSGLIIAAAVTAAAVLAAGAVCWYRSLPRVRSRRRQRERQRMIETFRKHLPRCPGTKPPEPSGG